MALGPILLLLSKSNSWKALIPFEGQGVRLLSGSKTFYMGSPAGLALVHTFAGSSQLRNSQPGHPGFRGAHE